MGCSQSTADGKEALNRCKERKKMMKQSISAYHAFAAAHFAYATSLKNTGAALSNYAQGQLQFPDHLLLAPPHPRHDSLPPPPHSDSSDLNLHSKTIVDEVNCSNGSKKRLKDFPRAGRSTSGHLKEEIGNENNGIVPWDFFFTSTDDIIGPILVDVNSSINDKAEIKRTLMDYQSELGGGGVKIRSGVGAAVVSEEEPPPPSMKKDLQTMNLLQVIKEVDDGFVKASESALAVSKILEANRMHYRSKFTDNPGDSDHSTGITRVIIWKRSFKRPQFTNDAKEDCAPKEKQSHSIIPDKMLAWEKKLYDEVKAAEEMKYAYSKKIASLNKLTKRGASSGSLAQTKTMVSNLQTRCILHMQSIDSIVLEINTLRDVELYPKLVQHVQEMSIMWENMRKQHENQLKMVQALKAIEVSQLSNETSEYNLSNTKKLYVHVKLWCSESQKLIIHQKEFVKSLNNWLNLNLISIDNNLINRVSSPRKPQNPKIQSLLRTWKDQLETFPEEGAKTAINNFTAIIDNITHYQSDEMQMKERCEETRRELTRKSRKFEQWCDKHISKRTPTDEKDLDVKDDIEVIAYHHIVMEALERRLKEEGEVYQRQCIQVKDTSLVILKIGLPEVFTSMFEFSRACSHMYGSLKSHTSCHYPNGTS